MTNYYVSKNRFNWIQREMKGNLISRQRVKYWTMNCTGNIGTIGHIESESLRTWVAKKMGNTQEEKLSTQGNGKYTPH